MRILLYVLHSTLKILYEGGEKVIIHTVSFRIELPFGVNFALRQKVMNSKTMFIPKFKNGKFIQY